MFTTPQDYINNYVQILKNEYQLNDLKIDYQGFVGFIMNLFGWTNFDIKQYYDYLYKEGFLATSDETRNLYLHGSTYNYPIDFAIPATASGNLVFDFSQLPVAASNILRREVVLPSTIQISAGNYIFSTTTQYTFIEDRSSVQSTYYCIINPLNSKQQIIASSGTIITVPFIDFTQQVSTTYNFNVSNYDYGTYSQYNLNITDTEQVANLEISVQLSGTTTYIPFNVKHITAFETPLSESVFLTQISNTQLILGTGNGYHGLWIPNSIMQVSLWTTQGANGNSLQRQIANITGALTMTQFDSNNTIIKQNSVVINNNLLKADFYSSTGGSDVLLGLDLKNDIVKWVESRNNLINQTDFYNLLTSSSNDFSLLFKKNQLVDNTFYLCRVMRDQYQNVLNTTNYTYPCVQYDNTSLLQNVTSTTQYYLTSTLASSRYYYKIVAVDKFYESIPSSPIIQNTESADRAVVLEWSPVPNAEYYKVYGRTSLYEQYWVVPSSQLTTDGLVYFLDTGITGITGTCGNAYKTIQQINFPTFNIDLEETITLTDDTYIWKTYTAISDTFYIDNKTFWFNANRITYNDTILTNVTSLDQLITNSWTIVSNILYLRLDSSFNVTTDQVIVTFNNTTQFFSPFIYKYNSFFNWFEGYFIFDNMIQYPIISDIAIGYTPPIFYFNLVYDYVNNETDIYIKSYQDISALTFMIMVNGIDIAYTAATYDNITKYFKYIVSGFIMDPTNILVKCYNSTTLEFTAASPLFQQVYYVSDQVALSYYYDVNNNKYICNIPVVANIPQLDYFYSQMYDYVIGSNISQNRMQSDTIQTRFLNTVFCEKYISQNLLTQQYDSNILLPLNMSISIKYNTTNIDFTADRSAIELLVANYLQQFGTGINISFYPSQIVDLIHNYSANIISVVVNVYDSYGTDLGDGIETIDEATFLSSLTTKLDIVKYTPIFWYWNLEEIEIALTV